MYQSPRGDSLIPFDRFEQSTGFPDSTALQWSVLQALHKLFSVFQLLPAGQREATHHYHKGGSGLWNSAREQWV